MSKTADQVKGVTSGRKPEPPRVIMPTNLDLKFMSKAKAVEWTNRYKRALGVAEDAKAKAMIEPGIEPTPKVVEEKKAEIQKEETLSELDKVRNQLADAQAKLADDPDNRGLKIKVGKLNKKLDKLENE